MKRLLIIFFALALFTACQSNAKKTKNESKAENTQVIEMQELELTVTGMTCSGCENTVKNGLKQIDGVVEVKASHKSNKVSVKVEKDKVKREEVAQQIETIGYKVEK